MRFFKILPEKRINISSASTDDRYVMENARTKNRPETARKYVTACSPSGHYLHIPLSRIPSVKSLIPSVSKILNANSSKFPTYPHQKTSSFRDSLAIKCFILIVACFLQAQRAEAQGPPPPPRHV